MYDIIGNIVGAALAVLFAGFFALKVGETPLIVIVSVFLALMVYSLYDDVRKDRLAAATRKQGRVRTDGPQA